MDNNIDKDNNYQLFERKEGSDNAFETCNKLLPLNPIKNTFSFNEVSIVSISVDDFFNDLFEENTTGSKTIMMGLSAHYLLKNRFGNKKVTLHDDNVVFPDYTFLPSSNTEELLKSLSSDNVFIDYPDVENRKNPIYGDKELILSDKNRSDLLEFGQIFYRDTKTKRIINVKVKLEEIVISNFDLIEKLHSSQTEGKLHKLKLSASKQEKLMTHGMIFSTVEGKKHKIVLENHEEAKILTNTRKYQQSKIVVSVPEDRKNKYNPDITGLEDNEFCERLNILIREVNDYGRRATDNILYALHNMQSDPRANKCWIKSKRVPVVAKRTFPKYEIGLVTTYEQEWALLGYSRGALLHSTTLSPDENLMIEVFNWEKNTITNEETNTNSYEKNRQINSKTSAASKIGLDVTRAVTTTAGAEGGLATPPIKGVTVKAEGKVSISEQLSRGMKTTLESTNEITRSAVEKFKSTHKVKVTETNETGYEERVTRNLKNHNTSRSLTFHHFEVLENYRTTTKVVDTPPQERQWCLLVDNPDFPAFDVTTILAYEHRFKEVLLSSEYQRGFEAARTILAEEWYKNSRKQTEALAQTLLNTDTDSDDIEPNTFPLKGVFATAKSIYDVLNEFKKLDEEAIAYINQFATHFVPNDSGFTLDIEQLKQIETSIRRFSYWSKMDIAYPGFRNKVMRFLDSIDNEDNNLFNDGKNKDEIIRQLAIFLSGLDDDWLTALKMIGLGVIIGSMLTLVTGAALTVTIGVLAPPTILIIVNATPIICTPLFTALALNHDDMGLGVMLSKARRQVADYELVQEAEALPKPVLIDSETTSDYIVEPFRLSELYSNEKLAEAHADFIQLTSHIEKHRVYYQNEIWRVEDPNDRLLRLESAGISQFIDNRLLGFKGKKAMYPLNIDMLEDSITDKMESWLYQKNSSDLDNRLPIDVPCPKVEAFSLPTPGVHMESVLGQCEGLEPYLIERRGIDKDERKANADLVVENVRQAALETDRRKKRLEQNPPNLDPWHVEIIKEES